MALKTLFAGRTYTFTYKNYAGELEDRKVIFESLSWGNNDYHPDVQWFLNGHCTTRNARRTFAMADIVGDSLQEGDSYLWNFTSSKIKD